MTWFIRVSFSISLRLNFVVKLEERFLALSTLQKLNLLQTHCISDVPSDGEWDVKLYMSSDGQKTVFSHSCSLLLASAEREFRVE